MFFQIALNFIVNGCNDIGAVFGIDVGFVVIGHGAVASVLGGHDLT